MSLVKIYCLFLTTICLGLLTGRALCNDEVEVDEDPSDKGCSNAADIVFVLDESGSIWFKHFEQQLDFVNHVVDTFDVRPNKTHIGVLTFGDDAVKHFDLGQFTDEEQLKEAIKGIKQRRGQTFTNDAIEMMRSEMFSERHAREWTPHIAVVITDGESNYPDRTAAQAKLAHNAGIQVFAIGVGHLVIEEELQAIASGPELVYRVDDYAALDELRHRLSHRACQLKPIPPPPAQLMEGCTGSRPLDLIWSTSDLAGAAQRNHAIDFIESVTDTMSLSPLRVQVGVTPSQCHPSAAIRLKDHDTNEGFNEACEDRRAPVTSHTDQSLHYIRTQALTDDFGARDDSQKIAVLIIDHAHGANLQATLEEAEAAKEAGLQIIVVGVGDVIRAELEQIASSVNDVLVADSYAELVYLKTAVVTRICHGLTHADERQQRFYIKRFYKIYEN